MVSFSTAEKADLTSETRSWSVSPSAPAGASVGDDFVLDRAERVLALELGLDRSGLLDLVAELRADVAEQTFVDRRGLDDQLLLADLLAQLFDRRGDLLDLAVGDVERVEDLGFGDAVGAGFDHQDGLVGSGDDQVEVEVGVVFLMRVDHEVAVELADADRTDVGGNRNLGDRQRRGGTVHREDVVGVLVVDRHRDRDQLGLVVPALGEERTDRTVDHAGGQGGLLAGPGLATEERAGDLAHGVVALFDVDGQGQEVDVAQTAHGCR